MEEKVYWTLLLDFYGILLTERQREALSLHLEEDLSYAEIAKELGVTRQASADAAGTARDQLAFYEKKLGLLGRHLRQGRLVVRAREIIGEMNGMDELHAILRELEDDYGV